MSSIDIKTVLSNDNLIKSLLGLNAEEFHLLHKSFHRAWNEHLLSKSRKRAVGGGRKGMFPDTSSKLFYILFYIKNYPTMDVAAKIFGVDRSRCCRMIQTLLPLLKQVLNKNIVLPNQQTKDISGFLCKFPEAKNFFSVEDTGVS